MKCTQCGGAMKPLFTSWFCPNDCDRPRARAPAARVAEEFGEVLRKIYTAPQAMQPPAFVQDPATRGQPEDFRFQWGAESWAAKYGVARGQTTWPDSSRRIRDAGMLLADLQLNGRAPGRPGDNGLPGNPSASFAPAAYRWTMWRLS